MNWSRKRPAFALALIAALAAAFYAGTRFGDRANRAIAGNETQLRIVTNRPDGVGTFADETGGPRLTGSKADQSSKTSVQDVITKARSQIGTASGMMYYATNTMKALAPLATLSEPEIREALEEIEATVANTQQQTLLYSVLLGRLAETDGPGAIAYAEEHLSTVQGGNTGGVFASILGSWAQQEPEAAWNWFLENREPGNPGKSGYGQLAAIFSAMGSQDVDGAFARLGELSEAERTQALNGIARGGTWNTDLREQILEHSGALSEDARKALYRSLGYQWAAIDPDGALEWIETLSASERKPLARQAGPLLMASDPARGAELMVSGASEQELPYTYSRVVTQWAVRDPNAAGEWLNGLPQGPELDHARSAFARSVTHKDPVSAMEWAKTVENNQQRLNSVRQVYTQWKHRDQAAADSALNGSGLSEDQIAAVRQGSSQSAGGVKMESAGRVIQVFR